MVIPVLASQVGVDLLIVRAEGVPYRDKAGVQRCIGRSQFFFASVSPFSDCTVVRQTLLNPACRRLAGGFGRPYCCLLRNQCIMCIGGTDIPVCANRGTDRNVCATDALVAQLSKGPYGRFRAVQSICSFRFPPHVKVYHALTSAFKSDPKMPSIRWHSALHLSGKLFRSCLAA